MEEATTTTLVQDSQDAFNEQYFRKLVSRKQKTVAKVRRIDVEELLELAWVDGMLEPFADRLLRSRPDLREDVERAVMDLRGAGN
jgi:DNA-binding GntR family transcriptional regulator